MAGALVGLTLLGGCSSKKDAAGSAKATAKTSSTASAASNAPSLTAPTTPIKASQPFTITWTGPNNADDYIDIVRSGRVDQVGDELAYVRTSAGNPAKLTAPEQPGSYDVRYVEDTGPRKVIAHIAINVVQ